MIYYESYLPSFREDIRPVCTRSRRYAPYGSGRYICMYILHLVLTIYDDRCCHLYYLHQIYGQIRFSMVHKMWEGPQFCTLCFNVRFLLYQLYQKPTKFLSRVRYHDFLLIHTLTQPFCLAKAILPVAHNLP